MTKPTFITWTDKCNNHRPPPALENSTKTPLNKYIWSLSKYHVNKFSYITQVKNKNISWISFNLLMDCDMWNWKSLQPIQMSAIADCPPIEAEQKSHIGEICLKIIQYVNLQKLGTDLALPLVIILQNNLQSDLAVRSREYICPTIPVSPHKILPSDF